MAGMSSPILISSRSSSPLDFVYEERISEAEINKRLIEEGETMMLATMQDYESSAPPTKSEAILKIEAAIESSEKEIENHTRKEGELNAKIELLVKKIDHLRKKSAHHKKMRNKETTRKNKIQQLKLVQMHRQDSFKILQAANIAIQKLTDDTGVVLENAALQLPTNNALESFYNSTYECPVCWLTKPMCEVLFHELCSHAFCRTCLEATEESDIKNCMVCRASIFQTFYGIGKVGERYRFYKWIRQRRYVPYSHHV